MNSNDTKEFDRERFEQLATKAQNNDLTAEEVKELREQIDALNEVLGNLGQSMADAIAPAIKNITEAFEPMMKYAKDVDTDG